MSKQKIILYIIGFTAVLLVVIFSLSRISKKNASLQASGITAIPANEYDLSQSKDIPGAFVFNYEFGSTALGKDGASFDFPIIPFDEAKIRKLIGSFGQVKFGLHRDAWGYPVRENAYQKIAQAGSVQKTGFLHIPEALAFDNDPNIVGLVNCRATTAVTGYFKAYFEEIAVHNSVGYDDPTYGLIRRTKVCQVLQDIATLIKLDQTNVTPDIIFMVNPGNLPASTLAAASAYTGYDSVGPDNGSLHKHIISHQDPTPGLGNFDAFVITNFTGVSWDDAGLSASTYSMQTVLYHEMMHALGFRSLLPEEISSTNNAHPYGTFDSFIYKDASFVNPYWNATTRFLQVPTGTPSSWFVNNSAMYRGVKNIVGATNGATDPVFTPSVWQQGSSLSHFDMARSVGQTYLMNPTIGTNTQRTIHSDEKEVLCDEGYQVLGMTGCDHPTPSARDDSFTLTGTTSVCIDPLSNDASFDAGVLTLNSLTPISIQAGDTLAYYSGTGCAGTLLSVPNNAKSIRFTGTIASDQRIFSYTIKDSVSNRISPPAIISSSIACSTNPNEYICNGGFEMGYMQNANDSQIGGMANVNTCSTQFPYVCIFHISPDILARQFSFSNPWLGGPFTDTYNGSPNNRYEIGTSVFYNGLPAGTVLGNYESIGMKTTSSLPPGTYTLTWKDIHVGINTISPSMHVFISQSLPILLPLTSYVPLPSDVSAVVPLINLPGNSVSIATPSDWHSYSTTFQIPNNGVAYRYVLFDPQSLVAGLSVYAGNYMDDISLIKSSTGTSSITGTVYNDQNNNSSLDASETGLNGVQVGLFQLGQGTPLQTMTTQNIPNLGKYSFSGLTNGTYYIALINESSYSSVTQPPAATGLIPGHSRVYTISATGGVSTNKNFGVVLSTGTPPPTVNTQCNGTSSCAISSGSSATISWTSSNATSCSVSPSGASGISGSFITPSLSVTTIYTTTCTSSVGTAHSSVTVTVAASSDKSTDIKISKRITDSTLSSTDRLITFQIDITNVGPADATHISMSDPIPSQLIFDSYTTGGGASYNASTGMIYIPTLPAGQSTYVRIIMNVPLSACGLKKNTVQLISLDQTDSNASDNISSSSIQLQSCPTKGDPIPVGETTSNG